MTLGEKLDAHAGRPSGFDVLRLCLAVGVVAWHTIAVTYGESFQDAIWAIPQYRLIVAWLLPAFFALSGFLVAGSLERCSTIAGFLFLRMIRIFPALLAEITISAFVLGPLMTQFTLKRYFHDPQLFAYFLNCLGDMQFRLPGLFLHNPLPAIVNGQLWTIPFELKCYVILAVLGILGISHRRWLFLLTVAAIFGIFIFHLTFGQDHPAGALNGHGLVMCFLFGVLYHQFRFSIPYNGSLAGAAFAATLLLFWIPGGELLAPLPAAYVTVFVGLANPPRPAWLQSGDYSYGIFLYGFPIQQAVATHLAGRNGWLELSAALPVILLIAAGSWHFWERPMLQLRRFRPAIDRMFGFSGPGAVLRRLYRLAIPASSA